MKKSSSEKGAQRMGEAQGSPARARRPQETAGHQLTPALSSGSLAPPSPATTSTTSSSDSSKEEAEEKPPLPTSARDRAPTGWASGSGVSGVMMRRGTGHRGLPSRCEYRSVTNCPGPVSSPGPVSLPGCSPTRQSVPGAVWGSSAMPRCVQAVAVSGCSRGPSAPGGSWTEAVAAPTSLQESLAPSSGETQVLSELDLLC